MKVLKQIELAKTLMKAGVQLVPRDSNVKSAIVAVSIGYAIGNRSIVKGFEAAALTGGAFALYKAYELHDVIAEVLNEGSTEG